MKVGRISILAALLLMFPLAAFAGGDPCAGQGGDIDGDGFCEDVDTCPGIANPGQSNPAVDDPDGDGRGVPCDNCTGIANGPLAYAAGLSTLTSQCDKDSDGYGNACDGDFNADGFVTGADGGSYTTALMLFFPPAPGQNDMNCDGFMTGADGAFYTAQLMGFFVGPSGWSCKGLITGACPSLP